MVATALLPRNVVMTGLPINAHVLNTSNSEAMALRSRGGWRPGFASVGPLLLEEEAQGRPGID